MEDRGEVCLAEEVERLRKIGLSDGEIAIDHTAVWEDPRPKVEAIREANDLSGYEIYPGMTLKLPSTI